MGIKWERVFGPDLDIGKADRQRANDYVFNNKTFIEKCMRADIPITRRQASKYRRKRGLAYNFGKETP